jgi:hypothetical protein
MKKLTLALVVTVIATSGLTRAAEKGQIMLDVGAGPTLDHDTLGTSHVELFPRLSYQLSDRVQVRPLLGLGHSSIGGWFYGLGAEASYQFGHGRSWTPYVGAGFRYNHHDAAPLSLGNYATYSAAGGLEYTISRRVGLFAEMRATHGGLGENRTELQPIIGFRLKAR